LKLSAEFKSNHLMGETWYIVRPGNEMEILAHLQSARQIALSLLFLGEEEFGSAEQRAMRHWLTQGST
jgi:hypothetical protein